MHNVTFVMSRVDVGLNGLFFANKKSLTVPLLVSN